MKYEHTRQTPFRRVPWRPGVFVASDLLEEVIVNKEIEFAGYIVNYIDRVIVDLKRRSLSE